MSREELDKSKVKTEEYSRGLRRSERTRRAVVPFGRNNKRDSESTETESESDTVSELGEGESSEGNITVVENPECSNTNSEVVDRSNLIVYDRQVGRYVTRKISEEISNREMFSEKELTDRPLGSTISVDSGMSSAQGGGMEMFMKSYFEAQMRRDDIREEQRQRERDETRAREDRLWSALGRATSTPEPEARSRSTIPLPTMKERDEITEFLPKFEAAVTWGRVPRAQWRELLVSHIPIDLLMRVKCQLDDETSTYDDIVGALTNSSTLTFGAAAEDLCTGERGRIWEKEGREAAAKIKALLGQVTREADDKQQILECLTVVLLRDKLVPGLKSYVDSGRRFGYEEFLSTCDEWERSQPTQTSWFKKRTNPNVSGRTRSAGPVLLWWRQ